MAACDTTRPLTDAQREAGFDQQRTGVGQALRPFSGSPTVENLIDYCNRELVPVLRATRNAANDVWKQVVDNAPSANPLAYYFATATGAADPTAGRIRLNQATQNTATIIRVSESNARLQSVQPWLDVMSGGPTTPLGTVTLLDAINPSRFLRFDLNSMTDQGAYWDLGVTIVESSDASPFTDGEAVTLGFIAGVSAAGSTVPVTALSPIATDTFVGNITGSTAAPAAVPLASVDSTSVAYDGTAHEFRRAALTGAIAASSNSNTTVFAGIRDNGSAENDRTNLNFLSTTSIISVVTDDSGNDELEITHERAALTGFATASQNSNATSSAEPIVTYSASSNMSAERVTTASTSITINTGVASQIAFERAALTGEVTASANANATTITRSTNFDTNGSTAWTGNHRFEALVEVVGHTHWRGRVDATLAANADDVNVAAANMYRAVGNGFTLTGMVASGDGQLVLIENADSGDALIIGHENTGSTAANRFVCPGGVDFVLPLRCFVWARYDSGTSRWFLGEQARVDAITASYASASNVTNSTTPITLASLSIPANSLSAGACFEFYGAVNWTRSGTTATSVKLSLKINGSIVAFYQTATATSGGIPGDASIHGFFNFLAVGASGSVKGHLAEHEVAPFGATTSTTSIGGTSLDTTSAITVAVTAEMTVATNQLIINGNSGLVQKRASSGSTW